ncbi:MAG: GNAT family N-acetyltransferase [Chloroflexota bacterium]|nr:GNAT family N-acetyltransferase [Chloroflexota bacterium]
MPDDRPVTPELLIRRAFATDADAVRQLVHAAYVHYEPLLGRTPMPMLTDYDAAVRDHEVWVLETPGGVLAAVLELIVRPGHLWIDNVAVEPAWQGRGLGRRLLAFADDEARRRDLPELGLLTNERYTTNIAMYERYGYRETRREPHLGTDLVHFRKATPR